MSNLIVIVSAVSLTQTAFNVASLVTTYSLGNILPSSSVQPLKIKPSFTAIGNVIISFSLAVILSRLFPPSVLNDIVYLLLPNVKTITAIIMTMATKAPSSPNNSFLFSNIFFISLLLYLIIKLNLDLCQVFRHFFLKDYWKLIVKNENDLNDEKKYSKHFKKEVSQKEIVQFLINTDKTFKATYKCYQGIINSLKENDFNKFKSIVLHNNLQISSKMKQALNLYKDNLKYIENSFKYDINNGIIEGTNNLIKCLKRIAFGYRKYDHFIARIFLIKGIIKG